MILLGCAPVIYQTHLHPEFRRIEADDVLMLEAEPKFFGYRLPVGRDRRDAKVHRQGAGHARRVEGVLRGHLRGDEARRKLSRHHRAVEQDCEGGRVEARPLNGPRAWPRPGSPPWTTTTGLSFDTDMPVEEGDCMVIKPWVADDEDQVSVRYGGILVVEERGARRLGTVASEPVELIHSR